ncbi:MAG: MarR family winged helix-turn-helix transcriptional regulator [Trueperaceae bacterium]
MASKLEKAVKAYGLFEDRLLQHVTLDFTMEAQNSDLSLSELNALLEIKENPDLSVSDIAEHTKLSLAAASQLVERLVKRNLVVREENPNNRRQKHVRLAKDGQKFIDSLNASYDEATRELLFQLPNDLLEKFEKLFIEVNKELEKR